VAIPTSKPLNLSTVQAEYGGSNPISMSEYRGKGNAPASGPIDLWADFNCTSSAFVGIISNPIDVPYRKGFEEQGSNSHTYSRGVSPATDGGSVNTQIGWMEDHAPTGTQFLLAQLTARFNPGDITSTWIRILFRDPSRDTSAELTSQATSIHFPWPMGNVTLASDSAFTQNVFTIAPADWENISQVALSYSHWGCNLGYNWYPGNATTSTNLYNLFANTVYVKIEP